MKQIAMSLWCRSALPLLLATAAVLAGCGTTTDSEARLEHHVPAHKPATFRAALHELQRRDPTASGADPLPVSELRDIVGWLPELAAETDLPRADWELVQRTSQSLDALIQRPATAEYALQYRAAVAALLPLLDRVGTEPLSNHTVPDGD